MPLAVLAAIDLGGYINPWKILAAIVLLLVWTRLLTWIDKDSSVARLPREVINVAMFSGLILGYFCFFLLPGFGLAFGILSLLFVADIGVYLGLRGRTVGLKDLQQDFSDWMSGKFKSGPKAVEAVAGQVLLMDEHGHADEIPAAESPEYAQYMGAQKLLTRALQQGAEKIELLSGEPPTINYYVDGLRYDGEAMDSDAGGAAIQLLKRLSKLDMAERRKPQTGTMRVSLDTEKRQAEVTTFGSATGESVRILLDPQDRFKRTVEELGFTAAQLPALTNLIREPGGLVLISAPHGQGLTSLAYGIIRAHDAFLTHVHTVERAPEMDVEGVTQNAIAANASATDEAGTVDWVISQEPDVIMITSIEAPHSAVELAQYASDTRRVYICLRSGSIFEALKQWRKLVGDDSLAIDQLKMLISGRLVRRLCAACKVGYEPDPTHLRKLNMDPESVGKLFQARREPMRDSKGRPVPCNFCHDLAFKGRFGVFETMTVDDEVRSTISEGGTENQLKQLLRKQRGQLLQEVALAQVQEGETSLEEVLRVLKPEPPAAPAPPPAKPAAKAPPAKPGGPARPVPTGARPAAPAARPAAPAVARPAPAKRPPAPSGPA